MSKYVVSGIWQVTWQKTTEISRGREALDWHPLSCSYKERKAPANNQMSLKEDLQFQNWPHPGQCFDYSLVRPCTEPSSESYPDSWAKKTEW